jgi:antitoxin (DNA-binding transcriptional repressor) of toxin-antitoxin stability system
MRTVGTFEAETRCSALLEHVAREEITTTRHGKAVARLVPVAATGWRAPWRGSRRTGAGAGSEAGCR